MTDTKIFIVLDPLSMEQVALEWGEKIALEFMERRSLDVVLHVYCCMNEEGGADGAVWQKADQNAQDHLERWVQRLLAHTRSLGIGVDTEIEWADDWRKAIVDAIARSESNLVVKNMTHHSRLVRLTRQTADWQLLRGTECPTFLVTAGPPASVEKLLVAIKPNPDEEIYEEANDRVLATARRMADDLGATLNAVACHATGKYPDRQRFADRCGLQRNQVRAMSGTPEKVIASAATELDADILVIASVADVEWPFFGNTAQKVIDEIDIDVLVLPMTA